MFSFSYPWLFALAPLPWLVWKLMPARRAAQVAVRVPFGERLTEALQQTGYARTAARTSRRFVVPLLLWGFILTALARPQWIEPPIVKALPTRDLLLLVDLSSSMDQKDFVDPQGKSITRLEAVKEVLGDFLIRREGDRVGLEVFGDAPYLQAPFSTDLELSRILLDACDVGMAGPRTAFGDAIGLGVNLFNESDVPAKTIIALTDGNDTASQVPPLEAARVAAQRNIRIHTVAIGDPTTVGEDKLDTQALEDVAKAAGGDYFFAADRQQLAGIYDQLDKIETRKVETVSHRPKRDLYYVFLLSALFLAVIEKVVIAMSLHRESARTKQQTKVRVDPVSGQLEVVS